MQPRSWERTQDTKAERLANGCFRCDRCQTLRPLPWNDQDGWKLCRRCVDTISPIEQQHYIAEAKERGGDDPMTPLPVPPQNPFAGAASVTGVSPSSVTLKRGGASAAIVLTGVNFTASTTASTNAASVTVSNSLDSSTQLTLTITAGGGATPGDYDLFFNGDALTPRHILKVR